MAFAVAFAVVDEVEYEYEYEYDVDCLDVELLLLQLQLVLLDMYEIIEIKTMIPIVIKQPIPLESFRDLP